MSLVGLLDQLPSVLSDGDYPPDVDFAIARIEVGRVLEADPGGIEGLLDELAASVATARELEETCPQRRRIIARVMALASSAQARPEILDCVMERLPELLHDVCTFRADAIPRKPSRFDDEVAFPPPTRPDTEDDVLREGDGSNDGDETPGDGNDEPVPGHLSLRASRICGDPVIACLLHVDRSVAVQYAATMRTLLFEHGPLPMDWRGFIGLMASARHDSEYSIRLLEEYFLMHGGDQQWLVEPSSAPAKLHALHELNAMLAHEPWAISDATFRRLLQAGEDSDSDAWSKAELVHAMTLLTTFHAHASLAYSIGSYFGGELSQDEDEVIPEHWELERGSTELSFGALLQVAPLPKVLEDQGSNERLRQADFSVEAAGCSEEAEMRGFNSLVALSWPAPKMEERESDEDAGSPERPERVGATSSPAHEAPRAGGYKLSRNIDDNSPRDTPASSAASKEQPSEPCKSDDAKGEEGKSKKTARQLNDHEQKQVKALMNTRRPKFHGPAAQRYKETAQCDVASTFVDREHRKNDRYLKETDWSWEEDALILLSQFYPEGAERIHEGFQRPMQYTNEKIGETHIGERSTMALKEAVHNYCRCLYRVSYNHDFDPGKLNQILPLVVKVFLKKLSCYPERMTRDNYQWMARSQNYVATDMVHIALIGAETRKVCALLHGTQALKSYLHPSRRK